jgi:uncharacterized protein YbjT (DUF2867 family)
MILITGGAGFVGSHLIRRLRARGVPLRVMVRESGGAHELEAQGVEVVAGDIADRVSLEKAASGADGLIHLVGIIQEAPGATFQGVHVDGIRNTIAAAKTAGIRRFFFQSALGARPDARSAYHRTKWEAEELVRASGLAYTILRPSLICGPGDRFTARLAEIIRLSPLLPVMGSGRAKVQPIYIEDAVGCIERAALNDCCLGETCEIGGPDQLTYNEVTRIIAEAMDVRRPTVHVPLPLAKAAARMFEAVLTSPPLTSDQLIMLQEDNICSLHHIRDVFGIEPVAFRDAVKKFIAPKGQGKSRN